MSTATKWLLAILVVFNLFMAALMSLLYGYRVSYKQELAQTKNELESVRNQKDQTINQLQARRDSLQQEVANLLENLESKQQELDSTTEDLKEAQDSVAELTSRNNDLLSQVEQLEDDKSQLQTEKNNLQKSIESKNERIAQLEERKETISSQLAEVEADLRQKQVSLSEMEQRFVNTKSELKENEQLLTKYKNKYGSIGVDQTAPAVEGNVRAVNPNRNLVLINLGKNDGVKQSMRFSVLRGSNYVTELEVLESYDTWSAARSVSHLQQEKPKVGDVVTNISPAPSGGGRGADSPPSQDSENTDISPKKTSAK